MESKDKGLLYMVTRGIFQEAAWGFNLMLEWIGTKWYLELDRGIVLAYLVQFDFKTEVIEIEVGAFGNTDAILKAWSSVIQSEMQDIPDPNYIEAIRIWRR